MRADRIDIHGQRFGSWTVVRWAASHKYPSGQQQTTWLCRCDCGAEHVVQSQHLRNGNSTGCRECFQKARRTYVGGERQGTKTIAGYEYGRAVWKCDCGAKGGGGLGFRCRACRKPSEHPNAKPITFNGETLAIEEWGRRCGLGIWAMQLRLQRGWPLEKALTLKKGSSFLKRGRPALSRSNTTDAPEAQSNED